jgi:hypothetical protein
MRTVSALPAAGHRPDHPTAGRVPPAISRRRFLRGVGTAGATVAVLGTGGLSYRVFDTAVLDPDHGDAFDAWARWQDDDGPLGAVAAAILAANPHNSQAWQFGVASHGIDVYADLARGTGALDPQHRELHLGLGCAIENLLLAAEARGLPPSLTLLPDGVDGSRVAHIELGRAASRTNPLYEAIGNRHTNRGPYLGTPVPASLLADLGDSTDLPEVAVSWITDAAARESLGQLMVEAATAITSDEQQSRDSFTWFRPNDDAVQQHRDGLTLDGQGFGALKLTVAKLLPAASRTAGDKFWVDQTRTVHTATAAAYGIITVGDTTDVRSRLIGGRLLERIHLRATHHGIALHHMNQITERIDREQATAATRHFADRFASLLDSEGEPLATFRVGYPERAARLSPRRRLDEVTR